MKTFLREIQRNVCHYLCKIERISTTFLVILLIEICRLYFLRFRLRDKWSASLLKRREYLDEKIQSLISKKRKAHNEMYFFHTHQFIYSLLTLSIICLTSRKRWRYDFYRFLSCIFFLDQFNAMLCWGHLSVSPYSAFHGPLLTS